MRNVSVPDPAAITSGVRTVPEEQVVLLDDAGNTIGQASKAAVHHGDTPLHLAFSCYLFNDAGRVLLTRRALTKQTWPGVWTNSFCGHPAPGEAIIDAVHRRGHQELGASIRDVHCVLPEFRYRARAADGTVENEICPVFCALLDGEIAAAPHEVMDMVWVDWSQARTAAALDWAISPWAQDQIPLLEAADLPRWARPAA